MQCSSICYQLFFSLDTHHHTIHTYYLHFWTISYLKLWQLLWKRRQGEGVRAICFFYPLLLFHSKPCTKKVNVMTLPCHAMPAALPLREQEAFFLWLCLFFSTLSEFMNILWVYLVGAHTFFHSSCWLQKNTTTFGLASIFLPFSNWMYLNWNKKSHVNSWYCGTREKKYNISSCRHIF